jgi:arabinogalactan endo-1,4-beta-galactosidase
MLIFRDAGINMVRLRVWVDPPAGFCDTAQTLAMARRAHEAGLAILIDFHYSDTWADPGQQTKPAAWASLEFGALVNQVGLYTAAVLDQLVAQGTPPAIVQIGNEITAGMLWNEGRIDGENNWPRFGRLLSAGVLAVRQHTPTAKVMLHIDRGGDLEGARWWFDRVVAEEVSFDIVGLSYYPWWHGSFAAMEATVTDMAARYGKPVFIVETAYPFTLGWSDQTFNLVGDASQLLDGYAATPAGQAAYLRDVSALVANVPGGLGMGVCYWAPEWSAFAGLGSPWENLALFDFDHVATPGLNALGGKSRADFNSDGFLDFFDYDDYVNCFETGACGGGGGGTADFNGDGFVDFFDYADFVEAFETGC